MNNDDKSLTKEDKKHLNLENMDEQINDESSALGSMPEDVMDIDQAVKDMGLTPEQDGQPKELHTSDE